MKHPIHRLLLPCTASIYQAVDFINQRGMGVAFVVDEDNKFIGILTDGDVRRIVLARFELTLPIMTIFDKDSAAMVGLKARDPANILLKKATTPSVSLPIGTPISELINHSSEKIWIIPLLNNAGQVVDYYQHKAAFHVPISSPVLNGNELNYLIECVETSWISSQGRFVDKFEAQVAQTHDCTYGVAVANGTVALHLALMALGIEAGDEVVVPDLTFAATINAVLHAGATPVIVDVCPQRWTLSPEAFQRAITQKTKAVIPVHLYGQPADMDAICSIARKYDIFVIEDCAESLGAAFQDYPVGSWGDIGCFSFFGNKIITTGEGGMCITKSSKLNERMQLLRDHGMRSNKKYWHEVVGYNYRMTNMQAAIGCAQMERLPAILSRRQAIRQRYEARLLPHVALQGQPVRKDAKAVVWLVCMLMNDGRCLQKFLKNIRQQGIDIRPFFHPLSDMDIYRKYARTETPITHELTRIGMLLPTSLEFDNIQIDRIAQIISDCLQEVECENNFV